MAKKQKDNKGPFEMISLLQLSKKSGISYQRLYAIINGRFASLDPDEKTLLANTLHESMIDAYKQLGFRQEIHRLKS
jgi:hypothetical protein